MAEKKNDGQTPEERDSAQLQKEIEALQAKLKASEEEKTVLLDSNKELQGELEAASETVKSVKKVFTLDKKQYEVLTPSIKLGGVLYTAEQVCKDSKIAKALIDLKSGAIRPLK